MMLVATPHHNYKFTLLSQLVEGGVIVQRVPLYKYTLIHEIYYTVTHGHF